MASTLKINNLDTASGTTITIPTGKTLVGTDTGSVKVPGMVVQTVTNTSTSTVSNIKSALIISVISPDLLIIPSFKAYFIFNLFLSIPIIS